MSPSQMQRFILKRQFVCVIVHFWNEYVAQDFMFMALQGESLELENVMSDFIMSSFLLMCPFCQK